MWQSRQSFHSPVNEEDRQRFLDLLGDVRDRFGRLLKNSPPEADPPLVVDPDAPLTLPVTLEGLLLLRVRSCGEFPFRRKAM